MTPETLRLFLSNYLGSLAEETQETSAGRRFGFDHVIEQIGVAKGWMVHRTPSHPPVAGGLPKPKKEAEHGIDYAFFSADCATLFVLVLKDEALTYKNFRAERFDLDITSASRHDLTQPEYKSITAVKVILAYNKGEEEEGIEEYTKLIRSLGTKVGDHASLEFERWNLDRLVAEVETHLLTPALLPANFFRALTYICWQVGDFSHGSNQWAEVLIPDWKEFLESLLSGKITTRSIWMVAVALSVVRQHGKEEPSFETGWIDLLEWAVLALWRAAKSSNDKAITNAVFLVWVDLYAKELEVFYDKYGRTLGEQHALTTHYDHNFEAVTESYLAFWHLGRLGILWSTLVTLEFPDSPELKKALGQKLGDIARWMYLLIKENPGARRPILDVHHVEYFLYWRALFGLKEQELIHEWLGSLYEALIVRRRRDHDPLRLIASDNDWESVFEFIVSGEPPSEGYGRSSYLLLMLMELGFSLAPDQRDDYLTAFDQVLLNSRAGDGGKLKFKEPVELAGWAPPANWTDLVLHEGLDSADDTGVSIMTHNFVQRPHDEPMTIAQRIESFVKQTRSKHPFNIHQGIPFPVLALGCIKTRSPLPSEYWRQFIFRKDVPPETSPTEHANGQE